MPLTQIWVNRESRQRRKIDTSGLRESIALRGVLSPIIIKRDGELVAGERRLTASLELGLPDIPVRFADELSPRESAIIELEENIKRQDIEWKEQCDAIIRIHTLFLEDDPEWTAQQTADQIGLSRGHISVYMTVAEELTTNPRVEAAGTLREAYNVIKRREARNAGEALSELLETTNEILPIEDLPGTEGNDLVPGVGLPVAPKVPSRPSVEDTIRHESFLEWAPRYAGRKFNLIHCDFPYGIDVFSGEQIGDVRYHTYKDSRDIYFTLLECLCNNLNNFMSPNAHLMFWYSAKHREATQRLFKELAPSLTFYPHDLIWFKSDNAGTAGDATRHFRHVHETCMFAYRSGRQLVQVMADTYPGPTDRKFHPSTKPEPMLRHFFSALVDESTSLLDPTCGSGSALRAAESLGAASVLGLESDEEHCRVARQALRQFRALRNASKGL
jgi:ParB/RepB/Spo0J family partition protein